MQRKINKQLNNIVGKKLRRARKVARSKKTLKKLADELIDRIFMRTKAGYGVDHFGDKKHRLKPLSTRYVKQRKKMNLGYRASPRKSNLTKSGSMLKKLYYKVKRGFITISTKDQEKVGWNSEMGRKFLNLSAKDIEFTERFIKRQVRKYIFKK